MVQHADVVVIGGGVIGAAVAYYLASEHLDVFLVEKSGIAHGSSGRCDGGVIVSDAMPGYDAKLKKMGQDLFPILANELDDDIGWTRTGSALVIENEMEMEAAKVYCEQLIAEGLPSRILDKAEMLEEEPFLSKDIAGGMEMACDGSVNPMALAHGLANGAKRLGAQVKPGTSVENIRLDTKGRIASVVTSEGDVATPRLVNAAGIWAPEIGRMVGLKIPIKPRQGQLLVGERTFPITKRKIVQEFGYNMVKFEGDDYKRNVTAEMEKYGVAFVFESTEAANFIVGSSRVFGEMDTSGNIHILKCIAERALRFMPGLRQVKIIRNYAGLRPYTPDHFPIVSDTTIPGFYIAAGHEGSGIGLSLITGKLMSQIICDQEPEIDPKPLAFSRFSV